MSELANRVSAFWYKGALGQKERLCLTSFVQHGHDVDLYTYDDELIAPEGVRICPAGVILAEAEVFFYQDDFVVGKISAFSNLFRYAVLHARGGWWIDTDVVCLRRLPNPVDFVAGFEDDDLINTAIMFSPADTDLMRDAIGECKAIGRKPKWGDGGPGLLTRLVKRHGLLGAILPVAQFYPIHWSEAVSMLLLPENAELARNRCSSSSTLHLWNEMFGRLAIPKTALPPPMSFLAELFQRFGFDLSGKQTLDPESVAQSVRAFENLC